MTTTDEKTLWIRWREHGDASAREQLILRHMRVVKYIAGRMAIHVPSSVEMNDLVSWGILGLLDAVEKFDHRQDIKFPTYASIRIRGAIIDQIRSLDWAPRSLRAMGRKVASATQKLRNEKGQEPSAQDIAAELGTTEDQIDETLSQLQTAQILSLDDYLPSEDSEDSRRSRVAPDLASASPEVEAQSRERQETLVKAIQKLPDQQQKVLNLYYYQELTLKEIGVVLEVSESRVCQIHSAAVKTLRKVVRGHI
ncbi:MAG: FliA/WhiG family RNA polymerase sigma factor [Candidatus Hydrogenedentes bacterium]|nr:FliA/WhiG family RNA polymerase sigma factor [Candidatus Hydrogenedentota bacterium]